MGMDRGVERGKEGKGLGPEEGRRWVVDSVVFVSGLTPG